MRVSFNNGATWGTIATGVTGKSYDWTVPAIATSTALVRVIARDTGWLAADDSDATFTIALAGRILSPNGGETFNGGSVQTIMWSEHPDATSYNLKVSYDNGATWADIAAGIADTSYLWTVPEVNTETALIRVISRAGVWLRSDDSDAPFTISTVGQVVSPNGGEILTGNSQHQIEWTTHPDATSYNLKVSYDSGATWADIANGVTGTTYDWTVPNVASATARIRVISRSGVWLGSDDSNANFTIVQQ